MEITSYIRKFCLATLSGFGIFLAIALSQPHAFAAGTFSLVPASGSLLKSCTASVAIQEAITSGASNAADIIITYNPAEIDIVDALPAISGTQILPGNAYESYAGNTVNTMTGTIKLVGYSTGSTLSSTATFATILFKPKPAASSGSFTITFTGANPYNSLDSNIADATNSYDMLAGVSNASYTFTTGSCAIDSTPPTVTFTHPTNLQNNIPPNDTVSLTLQDSGSGVALSTFSLTINGVTYTSTSPGVTVSGSPLSYSITIVPSQPFPANSLSVLSATVQDTVGNSRTTNITVNAQYSCPAQPVKYINSCAANPTTPVPTTTVDIISPAIVINTPLDQLAKKQTKVLSITTTDTSGISAESFLLTLGNKIFSLQQTPTLIKTTGNKTSITFDVTIDIDTLVTSSEGIITGLIKVSDLSGNTKYETLMLDTGKKTGILNPIARSMPLGLISSIIAAVFCLTILGALAYMLLLYQGPVLFTIIDQETKKPLFMPQVTFKSPLHKKYAGFGTLTGTIHKSLPKGEYVCVIQKYGYQEQTIHLSVTGEKQQKPMTIMMSRI